MDQPTYMARCNHCSLEHDSKDGAVIAHLSILHEENNTKHRVTVWDSPTSQLPRWLWTSWAKS